MSTATLTLTEVLLARIAEDELNAIHQLAPVGPGSIYPEHKARVLAECEAKRRIVEVFVAGDGRAKAEWQDYSDWLEGKGTDERPTFAGPDPKLLPGLTAALRLLALPYADHPDFRDEWRA